MPLAAGHRLGRYEIRTLLGVGGMGEVYLAQDTKLNRKVALKLLLGSAAANPDRLRRFTQEAQAASALNHPNIVTVHDVDADAGVHYITTEFIEGETLRRRLERGRLPLADALRIAIQVADALAAAHRDGIVHRDVKPENLLLRPDGYVKVVDFGLAKLTEAAGDSGRTEVETRAVHNTAAGVVLGTVAYMSPEQARGLPVDYRTDVWSLGVVLYEMLAGRRPFEGPTSSDVIAFILHQDPPKLTALAPESTDEIELVVETALAKDAAERYQSAREFLNALKRVRHHIDSAAGSRGARESDAPPGPSASGVTTPTPSGGGRITTPTPAGGASQSSISVIANELKRHAAVVVAAGVALLALVGIGGYFVYRQAARGREPRPFEHFTITRLTTSGKVLDAAISPDGRYVVHSVQESAGESLWLRRVKTDSNINLMPTGPVHYHGLSFSPDGEYVYYTQEDSTTGAASLYQIPVLGGASRRVVEDVDTNATFSPDGSRLAFVRGTGPGTTAVVVTNADGSGERRLATVTEPRAFRINYGERVGPAWSPDGRAIAVPMEEPEGLVVATVDAADGSVRVLGSRHWPSMRRVGWLADGSGVLAAVAENAGAFSPHQVWLIPISGAEPRRITSDLNNYAGMSTTSAGNAFVAVQITMVADVWTARGTDLSTATQITSSGAALAGAYGLTWTPDDRLIFFMASSSGGDLWSMHADGTDRRPFAAGAGINFQPVASADGRYVVFNSNRGPHQVNLWRASPDGSNPVQLTKDGDEQLAASISPDSRTITYGVHARLWRMPIEGGTSTRITDTWSMAPRVSPDASLILCAYKKADTAPLQLAFRPYDGGTPLRIVDVPPTFTGHLQWAPDGRAAQVVDTRDDVSNIWSVAHDTGAFSQVTHFTSDKIYYFAWSHDGTRLALSRGRETSDAVLVTDEKP
jgi:eukaryotic-like serine/threonine-protein kinase